MTVSTGFERNCHQRPASAKEHRARRRSDAVRPLLTSSTSAAGACATVKTRGQTRVSVLRTMFLQFTAVHTSTLRAQHAAGRAPCDMQWQLLARAELRSSCHGPWASWPSSWHRRSSRIEGEVTARHRYLTSWRTQPSVPPKAAAELCFMVCRRVSLLGARQHRLRPRTRLVCIGDR